jgi:hypothetical protein
LHAICAVGNEHVYEPIWFWQRSASPSTWSWRTRSRPQLPNVVDDEPKQPMTQLDAIWPPMTMMKSRRHSQCSGHMRSIDAIWQLPSAAVKFADLVDGKVEGSRPDNKIQSPRSPRSAPIDEG